MRIDPIRLCRAASACLLLLLSPFVCRGAILINEVAPGVNSLNTAEFVELFNTDATTASLTGWKLCLRTRSGTSDSGVLNLAGQIPPQSYFLITGGTYNAQRTAFTPNLPLGDQEDPGSVVGTMSADNGQLGLKNAGGTLVDGVGWWVADFFSGEYVEGTSLYMSTGFSSRGSITRNPTHTDTNNNSTDFTYNATTISPTNSGSTQPPTPPPVTTSTIYPYLMLQHDPSNSVVVNWWNPDATGNGWVDYGLTSAYGASTTNTQIGNFHHVELTGLVPATTYHYRIHSSDGTTDTQDCVFTTAQSSSSSFTFAVFGDTRGLDQGQDDSAMDTRHKAESDHIAAQNPAFVIHTGDYANQGNNLDDWKVLFWAEQNFMKKNPIVPIMGNHEVQPNGLPYYYFSDAFAPATPTSSFAGSNGRVFSFNYGNAHFVVLSSYQLSMTDQATWLAADLAAARANPSIKWIFACMHNPMYTSSNHSGDTNERSAWGPLFDQYRVDMVFAGHNHLYERTYPIVNQTTSSTGTIYITSGLGGGPFNGETPTVDSKYIQKYYTNQTATAFVTINGGALSLRVLTAGGALIDSLDLGVARAEDAALYQ